MAEETIISNVGGDGDNSVASEATLRSLSAAIEKLAKQTGKDPAAERGKLIETENKARKSGLTISRKYNDELDKSTDLLEDFGAIVKKTTNALSSVSSFILGSLTGAVYNFAEELLVGGNNLSDFAQHIPIVGSLITVLTDIIDDSIYTFREISQVGATFAGGLDQFRKIAGAAAIPLDDFRELIISNSETMKVFGSTTAQGAINFAAMSRELREGAGRGLMNLGFTTQDVNRALLDYADIQAMISGTERAQSMITTQNAAEFGMQLQRISAITGKRRDQIAEEMRAAASDARGRAALARLSEKEREQFLENISTAPQEFQRVFTDMADGIPNDEVTQQLLVFSDTFRQSAGNISSMTGREFNNFMVQVRDELLQVQNGLGRGFEGVYANIPAFASAFDSLGSIMDMRRISEKEYNDYLEEQNKSAARSKSILQFEQVLNRIRGNLQVAFVESGILKAVEDFANELTGMIDKSLVPMFSSALTSIINYLQEFLELANQKGFWPALQQYFKDGMNKLFSEENVESVKTFLVDVSTAIGTTLIDGIKNLFSSEVVIGALATAITGLFATIGIGKLLSSALTAGIDIDPKSSMKGKLGKGLLGLLGKAAVPLTVGTGLYSAYNTWNDDTLTPEQRTNELGGIAGGTGGALAGAAAGAALGSFVPVIGNVVGGILGGTLGYFGGDWLGRSAVGSMRDPADQSRNIQPPESNDNISSIEEKNQREQAAERQKAEQYRIKSQEHLGNIQTANLDMYNGIQSLNTKLDEMISVLNQNNDIEKKIERNTSSLNSDITRGRVSVIR